MVRILGFHCLRAWVLTLVRELKSYKPDNKRKKLKVLKNCNILLNVILRKCNLDSILERETILRGLTDFRNIQILLSHFMRKYMLLTLKV